MPLPPDFAQTGLHIHRADDTAITRFQVLGERSSGTNFVKRLLGRNSALTPSEALGWKHGFAQMMAVPADMAVICVVRRADSWARSMFSKPWHTTETLQRMTFPEFIRAEWDTVIDRPRYFGGLIETGSIGTALQQDRDPVTGHRFANLFALRQAKLRTLTGLLGRDVTCVFLRMEDACDTPQETLRNILGGLGAPAPQYGFRPVIKRLGSKFKASVDARPALPQGWSDADHAFLRSQIDPQQEAQLGYSYTPPAHSPG